MSNKTTEKSQIDSKLAKKNALSAMTNQKEIISPKEGWIEIEKEKLSYQGRLYNDSYRFQVKPCNAGLLKYFSTLDENNPLTVQDALLYVIKEHVRIFDGNRLLKSLDTIYDHDKFYFTMLVHLFSGAPTELQIEVKSPHDNTGKKQIVNVSPYNLVFKDLTEKGLSYLDSSTGQFNVVTKTLGTFVYKPLTCQQSVELTQFMLTQQREGNPIEPFFMQASSFFAHDISNFEKGAFSPEKIYQKYLKVTSDMKVASVLSKALEHIEPEIKYEIDAICEVTKRPFRAPITSLSGVKDIFLISDSESELQ